MNESVETVGDFSKAQDLVLKATIAIDEQQKLLDELRVSLEEYRAFLQQQVKDLRDLSVSEYDHE